MIEGFAFAIAGILLGFFTGFMPGIHLNTACFFAAAIAIQGDFNIAVFVGCMSIAHCFADFVPSVLLGASDNSSNCASILPSHRLFLEGKALEAIFLSCIGCLFGFFFSIAFAFFFVKLAVQIWGFLPALIPAVLSIVLFFIVFDEKTLRKKAAAFFAVALSSILGFLVLGFSGMQDSLLALVSGFFAAAGLLFTFFEKPRSCPQELKGQEVDGRLAFFPSLLGSIAGALVCILPSIGPSEAALSVRKLAGELSERQYLVMLGSISSANTVLGFFMLFFFGKTRNGSAVALQGFFSFSQESFLLFLAFLAFSAGISFILCVKLSRKAVFFSQKANYPAVNAGVLLFLALVVFAVSGFFGLLVFFTSACIGFFAISQGIRRSACMAFLIFPTLLFYTTSLI